MLNSPFDFASSLHIGTVIFVSPDEIKVQLEIDAPDSVALNAGAPRAFPRINSYLLVPSDTGFLVGQVQWITIENSQYPKRKGLQDFGLIDLPFPLRKLSLSPLGMLYKNDNEDFEFRRGIDAFPSVGDAVLFPTDKQMRAIVTSGRNLRVKIGTSPLAGNADVKIDPDRLFGRHVAVLGNTGSGKSCSVAGLIRWSLEATHNTNPNSHFIVLDPNGEYSSTFIDLPGTKTFSASNEPMLQIPFWLWNAEEWCAFTQASGKIQAPFLRRALKEIKAGQIIDSSSFEELKLSFRRYLYQKHISINMHINSDAIKNDASKVGFYLKAIWNDLNSKRTLFSTSETKIQTLQDCLRDTLANCYKSFDEKTTGKHIEYYTAFSEDSIRSVDNAILDLLKDFGGIILAKSIGEDCPIPFDVSALADYMQELSIQENLSQFTDFLVMRIRTMLADKKIGDLMGSEKTITLFDWLNNYIGTSSQSQITVIDLSLIPSEIVHIVTSVISRIIFEALQRYRKLQNTHNIFPTVIVMEEAHTFVKRYRHDSENQDASIVCCKVFERIAREGRKFGLGLVLSSQRPSELSPTVLSQCNTFLLHRIANDEDQDLVHRLLPDNLKGLLRDLPILPARNAILLGWASELPVLVKMRELEKEQRPQSEDPDFWNVWTRETERDVNWQVIADDWQGKSDNPSIDKSSVDSATNGTLTSSVDIEPF